MSKSKILVVDDEKKVLDALRRQLYRFFDVTTANDGKEALEKMISHGPFAVVVSDMKMPGLNGAELLSRIEKIAPNTVRVMLTGNVDQATAVQAINQAHTFRFLTKPCAASELIKTINEGVEHYNTSTNNEPAQKARAAFLSVINHELRTPLNPIIAYANILLESDLDQENKECVLEIIDAGNHMVDLINDLCAYVEINVGGINISSAPFPLDDLCRTVFNRNRKAAEAKSLVLKLKFGDGLPQLVLGDFKLLAKVLNHLLNNAIKYTETGEICLELVINNCSDTSVNCRFEIHDTGVGIDSEIGEKIFEPCFQVDSSMTRKGSGLGIGLSVCQGWVNALAEQLVMLVNWARDQPSALIYHLSCPKNAPRTKISSAQQ